MGGEKGILSREMVISDFCLHTLIAISLTVLLLMVQSLLLRNTRQIFPEKRLG